MADNTIDISSIIFQHEHGAVGLDKSSFKEQYVIEKIAESKKLYNCQTKCRYTSCSLEAFS